MVPKGRKQLNAVSPSGFQVLLTGCVLVQAAHSHEKPSDYHIWAARPLMGALMAWGASSGTLWAGHHNTSPMGKPELEYRVKYC